MALIHGHRGVKNSFRSREYISWSQMRQRCNNPKHHAYARYGGRGIKVCKRWDDFRKFYTDMGDRPAGCTLDRIKVNRGYSKRNCKWSTVSEQNYNRRKWGKNAL